MIITKAMGLDDNASNETLIDPKKDSQLMHESEFILVSSVRLDRPIPRLPLGPPIELRVPSGLKYAIRIDLDQLADGKPWPLRIISPPRQNLDFEVSSTRIPALLMGISPGRTPEPDVKLFVEWCVTSDIGTWEDLRS